MIAGCGMFLSTLDSGIINIALPSLMKAFSCNISTAIWSVTFYTLILSASILLFGRLADRLGRMKVYIVVLVLFAVSSLLCGAAPSIYWLIIFRGVQGLSAAMMQATSIALITTRLSGDKLNKAMGMFGMMIGVGPMLGPVVGGLILSVLDWRWIFWVNIPICLLGLCGCYILPKVANKKYEVPTGYLNVFLLVLALMGLLFGIRALSQGSLHAAGIIIIAALIVLALYLFFDHKTQHPLIPIGLFSNIKFLAPIAGIIAYGGATAMVFMLPPLYFEKLRNLQSWQVGLISFAAPLGIIISARLASKIVGRFGTVKPMVVGLIAMLFSLLTFTQISLAWPIWMIFGLLLFYGLGGGLFQTPCYLNLMAQFPGK